MCFRQLIGIPMGSDPAPFMANLFLYHYEKKWLQATKKRDIRKARRFGSTFRFIDDLCAINDNSEFEKNFKDIYPEELDLKKENANNTEASFLDISITIDNKRFSTKLYDKRDSFPFYINRVPFLESNIPSKIFYASVSSEILRIARTTSDLHNLIPRVNSLLHRMKTQGSECIQIISLLKKLYGKNLILFKKIADTPQNFINLFSI